MSITVKELREALRDVPDDTPVIISFWDDGAGEPKDIPADDWVHTRGGQFIIAGLG